MAVRHVGTNVEPTSDAARSYLGIMRTIHMCVNTPKQFVRPSRLLASICGSLDSFAMAKPYRRARCMYQCICASGFGTPVPSGHPWLQESTPAHIPLERDNSFLEEGIRVARCSFPLIHTPRKLRIV